ncbi:diadenylate cyclase CdaA [Robertkochia flava]|uniref:diadenylate cyclase CdaA n=1 Tax=Robertkochia flava TaxID=3447986 RepID=UPI001CCF32DD|nr:diadenylate cyclase CdaA [Robertkochia marina]
MELFDFLDFQIIDIIDIVLVAFLMYSLYKLLKGTVAINIFLGIVIIYIIYLITEALNMRVLSNIFGRFIGVGFFALIVVFQQEIRKFLLMIGSTNFGGKNGFSRYFKFLKTERVQLETDVEAIVQACEKMSKTYTGAIIVIERNSSLEFVKNTGDSMNIEVTQPILESIFFKNSPLHDGAVIIEDNRITATRVILPVSNERNIPLRFGLRHRAAVGITEKTDAVALVVSEETGQVSYIKNGEFVLFEDSDELIETLKKDLE